MPVLVVGGQTGIINESGKIQSFSRDGTSVDFAPGAVVPSEFAFLNGCVHPSLLPPPEKRVREYKRCGCAGDEEEGE